MTFTDQATAQFLVVSSIPQAVDLGAFHHFKHQIDLGAVGRLATDEAMTGIRNLLIPAEEIGHDVHGDAGCRCGNRTGALGGLNRSTQTELSV